MGRASRFDKPICWRAGSRSAHAWILTFVLALTCLAGQHVAYAAIPIRVSDVSHNSVSPQIAAKGKFVYVVWEDNTAGSGGIFFARSRDKGATFPSAERHHLTNYQHSYLPKVAASGPYVFVVWRESPSGKLLLRYSTDHGRTFNDIAINLSLCVNPSSAEGVQIAASGNTVHVIWLQRAPCFQGDNNIDGLSRDSYVHYRYVTVTNQDHSSDGFRFTDSRGVGPKLAVSGNNVYLTWPYTYNYYDPTLVVLYDQILFAKSINNGQDFNSFRFPFTHAGRPSTIVASGNNVYVDWNENTGEMLAASNNRGSNFNDSNFTPTNLSTALGIDSSPKFSASGNTLYLIGIRASSRGLLFWKGTNGNGGVNFGSPPMPITINPNFSETDPDQSAIAVSGQNVHVFYSMKTGANQVGRDIYYRHSSDSGGSFPTAEQNLSNSPGVVSRDMKIATYGDNAYVTWREDRTDLGSNVNHIMVVRPTDAAAEPTWLPPEPPSQLRLTP